MELRQIRYFQAVAMALSFSQAARRIRVAQPALSRQVKALEEELGVQLLKRTTTSVELTEAGRHFLSRCAEILSAVDRAVLTTQQLASDGGGVINIGSDWNIPTPLAVAARRLLEKHPRVTVNFVELASHDQIEAVIDRRLDVGFVPALVLGRTKRLRNVRIISSPLRVILPEHHRLAKAGSVRLRDLKGETWVGLDEKRFPGFRLRLQQLLRPARLVPKIGRAAPSLQAMIPMVVAGSGVAMLPELVIPTSIQGACSLATDLPNFEIHAIWRPDAGALVSSYLECLSQVM